AASNNNLDMFEEMKVAAILHKAHRWDPRVANAQEVFDMATLKGALALGRTDLGSIEVGKTADLVILNEKSVRLRPLHNVISHLVYSAQGSDVWSTIVNGRLTVFNGRVLGVDEEEVLLKVEERITRLLDNSS
ncbi:N-ethylammeline chlorohydrolase, partial [Thermococci archaeon]